MDLGFLGPVGQASVVIIPHLITCVASTSPSLSYLTIPYSLTHQVPRLFRLESPRIDSPSPPFLNCISSQSGLDNPTPRHHNKTADPYSHSHSWYIKTVYWFSATDTSLFSSSFFFFFSTMLPPLLPFRSHQILLVAHVFTFLTFQCFIISLLAFSLRP